MGNNKEVDLLDEPFNVQPPVNRPVVPANARETRAFKDESGAVHTTAVAAISADLRQVFEPCEEPQKLVDHLVRDRGDLNRAIRLLTELQETLSNTKSRR